MLERHRDCGRPHTRDDRHLVEGVHWDHRASPEDVGWKSIAVSVSDVAAVGPTRATLRSAPPPDPDWVTDRPWRRGSLRPLGRSPGGDTTRSPSARMVSVTMAGRATHPLLRSAARSGTTSGSLFPVTLLASDGGP